MRIIMRVVILSAMLFAAPQVLACDYPQRVGIPDGATVTKKVMIDGQRTVKSYMADMNEYLSCIESAEQETVAGNDNLDEDAKQQRIAMFNKKYNAAVEAMNLIAEQFNAQVRTYKDRSQ